jgi:hypothetical protein
MAAAGRSLEENVMTDEDIAKALAGARQDETPPMEIEGQMLAALRAAGLVKVPQRPLRPRLLVAAAVAAALLAGIWIGVWHRQASPSEARFLLLLYEDAAFDARHRGDAPKLEAEYSDWIRGLARSGQATAGEKLDPRGAELRPGQPATRLADVAPDDSPSGFFIIVAADERAALAIAETCPHLRYGGRVIVRPIGR